MKTKMMYQSNIKYRGVQSMIFVMLSPLLIIGFIALSIIIGFIALSIMERKKKTEKQNLKRKRIKFQILIMTTTTKLNKSLVMKGEQYESIHRGR